MEGHRLLDVPITEDEYHRRDGDGNRLLSFSDTSDDVRSNSNDKESTLGRFNSLRTAVQRVNDPDDMPYFHQRIPSNTIEQPQRPFNFSQPTNYDSQTTYTGLNHPPDLWRPFWTRKSTLGILTLLLLLIVVALVLLFHYSGSLDGFNVSSSTAYYAWTYTPVALILVLLTFWRQVDYYFKLLAPWDELRTGPAPSSKSLLLDYVSPLNVISFLAAFKRRYIPVMLSIAAFSALKVTALFSAALFVRSSTVVSSNSTSAFSLTSFDASSLDFSSFPNISTFTSGPVYSTLGNLAYNVPLDIGMGTHQEMYYAYNPVYIDSSTDKYLGNATYTAKTDALFPNLSCAPISVTVSSNSSITRANQTTVSSTNNYVTLKMPNGNRCATWINPTVYAMNPQRERTPSAQLEGTMQSVYCSGTQNNKTDLSEPAGLLFTVTDLRYAQTILQNGTIVNSTRMVSDVSSLLCIPNYYLLNAEVQNKTALYGANAVSVQMSSNGSKKVDGLSDANLAVIYDGIMNASQGILGSRKENPQAASIPDTVFNLMQMKANVSSLASFKDPKAMQSVAEGTFREVMAYYTTQSLTKHSLTNVSVNSTYSRDRLHVSRVPFAVVLTLTVLAACCTAGLALVTPGPIVPKDPSMIAMSAAVLARSPELNRILRKQLTENTALDSAMDQHQFSTAIATTDLGQTSFKVLVSHTQVRPSWMNRNTTNRWWSPNLLLLPAVLIAVLVPLVLIAVLEVLQRRSDDDQGLLTVDVGPNTALYARCIPVLVLMLIGATTEFVDFYVKLLSPWNKLASGDTSARRSLLSHLLGKAPPFALAESLRERHFGAVFSISAAVLASMFAVVGAGLYSVKIVAADGNPLLMVPADTISLSSPYNVFNDLGAAGILNQIRQTGISDPDGTFGNLVFSNYLQSQKQNLSVIPTQFYDGPITATIPVLRASLLCDIMSSSDTTTQYVRATNAYPSDRYVISSHYELPEFCQYGGPNNNSANVTVQNVFNTTNSETTVYGGQLLDLRFGRNSSSLGHYGERNAALVGNNPAAGCPSLAFTFAGLNHETNTSEVTTLICLQQIQQLEASVTYRANSSELDPDSPPVVNESTLVMLSNPNSTSGAKSFDWRIQLNVDRQLYGLGNDRLEASDTKTVYDFDAFFSYLLNNTADLTPESLIGSSNQQDLVVAVNTLYSKYMAQAMNANMRVPIATASNTIRKRQSSPSAVTVQTTTNSSRLVQSGTSTLVLQIFLGLSALFSALAYILVSFHHLLPHNPCTIAGTMSLLAGSDLCWTPADGLCDCCGLPRRSSWSHEPIDNSEETIINPDPSEYQNTPNLNNSNPRQRGQIISDGAEWYDHRRFAAVFASQTYSLGWWKENRARARRRRYGVDAGGRPDGDNDSDWELGGQRLAGQQGFEDFMMRGRDMLGNDQRGQYGRVNRAELSPDPGPNWRATGNGFDGGAARRPSLKLGRAHEPPLTSSPTLGYNNHSTAEIRQVAGSDAEEGDMGIRSPRRVRFQDRI